MNEFDLIRTFFASQPVTRDDVAVGIGDDASVVKAPAGMQTVVSTDVLIAGVHFPPDTDAASVGHKALAVNLSDLAAMGAEPAWFTLGLTLPGVDTAWLQEFCAGMFGLARRYNVQLIGGDTSRGPLAIAVSAYGLVPEGKALLRSGAKPGDRLYVTGELGDAGLALKHRRGELQLPDRDITAIVDRLEQPIPRIGEGMALRGIAHCAIDLSDGLLADLGHMLEASGVGARIHLDRIPLSAVYRAHLAETGWDLALANGDDYELCFTVPPEKISALEKLKTEFPCGFTPIGDIEAETGLRVVDEAGKPYSFKATGHDHFSSGDAKRTREAS